MNDGYKYILCAIDAFTRKAYVEPMRNRDAKECSEAFEKLVKNAGEPPRTMVSDHEGAFLNDVFQKVMDRHKIVYTQNAKSDHRVMGIIDNFAKRLKLALTY